MTNRIYLACPITKGDIRHNVAQADGAMAAVLGLGMAVLNPALTCFAGSLGEAVAPGASGHGAFTRFTHENWVNNCLPWVEVCDAVVRLPGESVGADIECSHAAQRGIPVFYGLPSFLKHCFNGVPE